MDTVIMATRIALLILATGTFTVIWSGDQPDQIAAVDRPVRVLVGKSDRRSRIETDREAVRQNQSSMASSIPPSFNEEVIAPLPRGITAGTYLVVDQFGRTEIRVISLQDAISIASARQSRPEDHFVVRSARGRWHYIRIEMNDPQVDRLSSATRPAIQ